MQPVDLRCLVDQEVPSGASSNTTWASSAFQTAQRSRPRSEPMYRCSLTRGRIRQVGSRYLDVTLACNNTFHTEPDRRITSGSVELDRD